MFLSVFDLYKIGIGPSSSRTMGPMTAAAHAMAADEENASRGRAVTAPTNGAAGVVPAVMACVRGFRADAERTRMRSFLLTSAAIGGLIERNASGAVKAGNRDIPFHHVPVTRENEAQAEAHILEIAETGSMESRQADPEGSVPARGRTSLRDSRGLVPVRGGRTVLQP